MNSKHPIALAYKAHKHVPTETYRRGQRKKMFNPIRTAPALVQAMDHLGPEKMTLVDARQRALEAVAEPEAGAFIRELDWDSLKQFLGTIALFLKASPDKGRSKGMNSYKQRSDDRLEADSLGEKAANLARTIRNTRGDVNGNKLKRLSAHIAAAEDKWAALASLARFYPLKGVPQQALDVMVDELGQTDLDSFKRLVAQALIFYEASAKGWKGLKS